MSGEIGYELFVRPEHAEPLWRTLTAAGDVRPYGFDALDVLRIEAGMILPGYDYTPGESSPFDINFERFMKIDGRSFHGDAAIRRRARRGQPALRLASLTIEGEDVPEAGAEVTIDGAPVGTATSPTRLAPPRARSPWPSSIGRRPSPAPGSRWRWARTARTARPGRPLASRLCTTPRSAARGPSASFGAG